MSFYDLTFISSVVKIPVEIHKLKWRKGGGAHRQHGDNINYSLRKKNSLNLTFVFVEVFRYTETFAGMETLSLWWTLLLAKYREITKFVLFSVT
jgi:hypothetical protein